MMGNLNLTEILNAYLHGSSVWAYLAVYLGGVLASFTPCVYPFIPITLGFIGGRSGGSRIRGFILSVFYVLGMALTYTALGAIAALSGSLFGQMFTSAWTYFIVANVCIIMGLAMLGVFSLPQIMPGFLSRMPARSSA